MVSGYAKTSTSAISNSYLMENHKIHIGNLVIKTLTEHDRSLNWLATKLGCDRSNLAKLLDQQSIQFDLLVKICCVLQENLVKQPLSDSVDNLIASKKYLQSR